MKNTLNIGVIVADEGEFAPITATPNLKVEDRPYFKNNGKYFTITQNTRTINVWAVHCGIGKVNAAAAAMHLIDKGADILLNYGLSGGVSGVYKNDDVAGTTFMEHDFDLMCLGYKKCEKPGQEYIYKADKCLLSAILKSDSSIKKGAMACGDCFVSSNEISQMLKEDFGICCCDMETAAIASVAHIQNIPFATLRRVSDDASDTANNDYTNVRDSAPVGLFERFYGVLCEILNTNELWERE